jgi:hypothetical protein
VEIRDEYLDKIESGVDRFMDWVVIPAAVFLMILMVAAQIMLAMAGEGWEAGSWEVGKLLKDVFLL